MLVDAVLSQLIADLKNEHLFEDSIIIVSADHGFRLKKTLNEESSERRIPLLIKLKGKNTKPFEINHSFNTMVLHEIVPALLEGRIQTAEQLEAFILSSQNQ